jgi:hypothetical protein
VLLARLERHAKRLSPPRIDGHPDDPARHLSDERVARRDERRVRTATAERHAKSLGAAHDDVRADIARRGDEGEAQEIGPNRD